MNRRQCMISVGAAGIAGLASRASAKGLTSSQPFFAHHAIPLGVQLYALQPDLEADFDGTLAKLNGIGIRSVEMAGFHGRTAEQIRASFDRAGLQCTSAHIPAISGGKGPGLDGDLDALARDMHVIGVKHVVIAFPLLPRIPKSAEDFTAIISGMSAEDWRRMAAFLNNMGGKLRQRDLSISYHNHNFEFAPIGDQTGLGLLLRETDPNVSFELGAGWVAAAGQDPLTWLRAHPRRFSQMHVKDIKATTESNFIMKQDPVEVGYGMMNWPALLPAAYAAGVRGFYVEQEPPFTGSRIDAVTKSADYLLKIQGRE